MATAATSLVSLYANLAEAIQEISDKYNAAPTTSSITTECSAISNALLDIQSLLSHPHALLSRVISRIQLEEALKSAHKSCSLTITALHEEVGRWKKLQMLSAESVRKRSAGQLCDEVLIKELLQHAQRQLAEVCRLLVAAQRNSNSEVKQLLKSDTFASDPIEATGQTIVTPSHETSGYNQNLRQQFQADSRSVCTRTSTNASRTSFLSERSMPQSAIEGDTASSISMSHLAPPVPELPDFQDLPDRTKKASRAPIGSIFFKLFQSNTELHRAAKKGDAKKIKSLLKLGVDVDYEGSSGCTALHLATDGGHEAAVKVLLDNGANPRLKSSEGRTALHSAARAGHTAVVRMLLEKGVDVQVKDPSGSTPLHMAAYNGQESVVQILLERHPVVESRGASGFTALHVASYNGQSAVVRLLVEMKANIEARSDTGRTALQLAAEKGHEAVVRHLLQNGANIMAKDNRGRTALQGAVSNQHGVVAQLLLDKVVTAEPPSPWKHQQDPSNGSTFELPAPERHHKVRELDASGPPTWSRQGPKVSVYELPTSSVPVELPAGNWNPD